MTSRIARGCVRTTKTTTQSRKMAAILQPIVNTRADWFKTVFLLFDRNLELARAVDVMKARAKRIYILMIKVNMLVFFFASRYFLKEIENVFSVFLSSYRNTRESMEELKKHARGSCSHSISHYPKRSLVFLLR